MILTIEDFALSSPLSRDVVGRAKLENPAITFRQLSSL